MFVHIMERKIDRVMQEILPNRAHMSSSLRKRMRSILRNSSMLMIMRNRAHVIMKAYLLVVSTACALMTMLMTTMLMILKTCLSTLRQISFLECERVRAFQEGKGSYKAKCV